MRPQASGALVPFTQFDHADPELFDELMSVVHSIASRAAFILGAEVEAFEDDFAEYCEAGHAVGVSSGTEALIIALRALGIGEGDKVLVPANSFIATAEAVSLVGAGVVFTDVDPVTGLMTADTARAAIVPGVRCIAPVHLYGRTVAMDPIMELAREAGAFVVEDTAQAHGARYKGRRVGTFGDVGCFSFYPAKNLGAWGDGGALVTQDRAIADTARILRSHGERPRYHHQIVGSTSRLDGLQAGILRVKLQRLEGWNEQRRRAAGFLLDALEGHVQMPARVTDDTDHVYHLFVIQHLRRDELREHLEARGIASRVHYPVPIHLSPAYANGAGPGSFPVSEELARTCCSLPMYPGITEEELERVAGAVREFAQ